MGTADKHLLDTQRIFSEIGDRVMSLEDARESNANMAGFLQTLLQWQHTLAESAEPHTGSQSSNNSLRSASAPTPHSHLKAPSIAASPMEKG